MTYIYKITNSINDLIYIGKTKNSLEERLRLHIKDSLDKNKQNRSLYKAMNEFGANKFKIELIEVVEDSIGSQREMCLIKELDTLKNGYIDTLGGVGRSLVDYEVVVNEYLKYENLAVVSRNLNIDTKTVRKALNLKGVKIKGVGKVSSEINGKSVRMIDINTKDTVLIFENMCEAARYLIKNKFTESTVKGVSTSIGRVCSKKRKTAFGFNWEWC